MSTRFKSNSIRNYNQAPLATGYENVAGAPDIFIPSCSIEDVDVAIFNLFDKEIVTQCGGIDGAEMKKVPVIFAAGEKWALLKKGRLLRDRNNTLLLPLITIMRTEINQNVSEDVAGRGINQQSGEIVVKRRLDKTDRDYQGLINKLLLSNQSGLSTVTPNDTQTAWFVAKLVDGSLSTETNFDDMSQQERYIKHTFDVSVPAYFFSNTSSGSPVPIKRYVSATTINFEASAVAVSDKSYDESEEYVLGSDDPTLPLDDVQNVRPDQRNVGWRVQKVYPITSDIDNPDTLGNDPAAASLPRGYVKMINRTSKGETTFSGASLGGLEIKVTK